MQPSSQLRIDLSGWLAGFALRDRSNGRDYYGRGRVRSLEVNAGTEGTTVCARVRGSQDYVCTLIHTDGGGGTGECSCPVAILCKHLYAAGTALLDRFAAETLNPFASDVEEPRVERRAKAAQQPSDEAPFVTEFAAATGKPPDRKQLAFLRNLLALHRRSG